MKQHKNLELLRHSAAHLLAHAIHELFPSTVLTIGPATVDGFFYDVLPESNFKEEDLSHIEAKMREIVQRNIPITHAQVSKEHARALYKNNPFKLELIESISHDTVGIATQGNFFDLCRGGHVATTGEIKHFMLLNLSGSYWRANKNNQVLQRISGTAFFTAPELQAFIKQREEAVKYDHRRLGKQLDLFSFHDEGPGFPFYHPHGKKILNVLLAALQKLLDQHGYQEISTPMMLSDELWHKSGHFQHYQHNMYFCHIDEKTYAIKPMNCPGAILIYQERPRSYKDLPMRLAETGLVHRFELSGVLHGLFRARAFSIDDGHIFCTLDQLLQEISNAITMTKELLQKFNFPHMSIAISTRPAHSMGTEELWEKATNALKTALDCAQCTYEILEGEGAFYGPKIEFHIQDSMGRSWQCATVQVDFFQSENFDLSYINNEGKKNRPVIIHRAIYGSLERFFGILLEHYKGRFPFWLAPVQIIILTITDEQKEYAHTLARNIKECGYRVIVDNSSDPLAGQIKCAQLQNIPWMLIIGNKEMHSATITLRFLDGTQIFGLTFERLLKRASEEL